MANVELEEDHIQAHEENTKEGNKKEEEAKELNESKEPHVKESNKEELIATIDLYRHQHHLEKQCHEAKGLSINELSMDHHGTINAIGMKAHGGLKVMHRDIRVSQ
jgi:hypothetical protein